MLNFIIGALVTYRISYMLTSEDAPFEILAKFRDMIGIEYDQYSQPRPTNELSKLFMCPLCLSVWVGLIIAFFVASDAWILTGLAYSGLSVFMERLTT